MEKVLATHETNMGAVYLYANGGGYIVWTVTNLMPGYAGHSQTGMLPYDIALARYEDAVRRLNGVSVPCACRFVSDNMRRCRPENCPRQLGGRAFWMIFGPSCNYRIR